MPNYLVFRLYGSMVAWGGTAVGGVRPSYRYPTKTAILGLLAAALGIKREQEKEIQALQNAIGFAIRVDHVGQLIMDYHTIQVAPSSEIKENTYVTVTRRNQLLVSELNTILSTREYYCDGLYTVILWQHDFEKYLLSDVQSALMHPKFVLCLGRKSCPLGLPIKTFNINSNGIEQALEKIDQETGLLERDIFSRLMKKNKSRYLYWEEGANVDVNTHYHDTRTRKDKLQNRQRWQFQDRREHCKVLKE